MLLYISKLKQKVIHSKFIQDSSWAIFGNGFGYALLLLAGIIIARLLGKDLYGEYGFIKTTMFQFAAFSTLGLGYTSTKFVAEYRAKDPTKIRGIIASSINITIIVSCIIALALFIFAHPLSLVLNEPTLKKAFHSLGIIIILRSIYTTQTGIISGYGGFKHIALINAAFGFALIGLATPLTFLFSLHGSLAALALSQLIAVLISSFTIRKLKKTHSDSEDKTYHTWRIIKFSIPVALQELTFALGKWGGILVITKLSTLGEVGLYTASELWASVILFVPMLLSNVMLSHLSYDINAQTHAKRVKMMICVNVACTLFPFILVYILSSWIVSMYGPTFTEMVPVMRTLIFTTIFVCSSNVLGSELIAQGHTWPLFAIRCTRDCFSLGIGYFFIHSHHGEHAALYYAKGMLICSFVFLVLLTIYYLFRIKNYQEKEIQ